VQVEVVQVAIVFVIIPSTTSSSSFVFVLDHLMSSVLREDSRVFKYFDLSKFLILGTVVLPL
jgi:hypothetical protein